MRILFSRQGKHRELGKNTKTQGKLREFGHAGTYFICQKCGKIHLQTLRALQLPGGLGGPLTPRLFATPGPNASHLFPNHRPYY